MVKSIVFDSDNLRSIEEIISGFHFYHGKKVKVKKKKVVEIEEKEREQEEEQSKIYRCSNRFCKTMIYDGGDRCPNCGFLRESC